MLLFGCSEVNQGGPEERLADVPDVARTVRPNVFLVEDRFLFDGSAASAELFRPADAVPPSGAHGLAPRDSLFNIGVLVAGGASALKILERAVELLLQPGTSFLAERLFFLR